MEQRSSITSLMSSFGRAYHSENAKNPVFDDFKARELMTDDEYRSIAGYILGGIDFFAPEMNGKFESNEKILEYLVNTQIAPTPLGRAAFCEESLKTAVRTGTKQYVILGAGMDTFAFRNPGFAGRCEIFEVDHPLTQAGKKSRIEHARWQIPDGLHFVPVDFTKDDLRDSLLKNGFDPRKKTFFSWLGVSMYLCRDDIEKMLDCIASLSAEGSDLVFDYADAGFFLSEVKRVRNMLAMAKAGGEEMKSGFDQMSLELMLADHGFLVYEHLGSHDIQKRYFSERTDGLSAFEHIGYVHACLKRR